MKVVYVDYYFREHVNGGNAMDGAECVLLRIPQHYVEDMAKNKAYGANFFHSYLNGMHIFSIEENYKRLLCGTENEAVSIWEWKIWKDLSS